MSQEQKVTQCKLNLLFTSVDNCTLSWLTKTAVDTVDKLKYDPIPVQPDEGVYAIYENMNQYSFFVGNYK